jgi:hypothetical protein
MGHLVATGRTETEAARSQAKTTAATSAPAGPPALTATSTTAHTLTLGKTCHSDASFFHIPGLDMQTLTSSPRGTARLASRVAFL